MQKRIDEIQVGDFIDFQSDIYADNGTHPEFEFCYSEVFEIEQETDSCIVLHCNSFSCGFPPNHVVCTRD